MSAAGRAGLLLTAITRHVADRGGASTSADVLAVGAAVWGLWSGLDDGARVAGGHLAWRTVITCTGEGVDRLSVVEAAELAALSWRHEPPGSFHPGVPWFGRLVEAVECVGAPEACWHGLHVVVAVTGAVHRMTSGYSLPV